MLDRKERNIVPQLKLYRDWLHRQHGLAFADYASMWAWSTTDLDGFWRSVWAYHDLESPTPFTSVVSGEMPTSGWFPGAQVNYARQVYRHAEMADAAGQPAVIAENERGEVIELSWTDLRQRSVSLALELRRLGVRRGDRVAAYLPNIPEAVIALLACASIGAIWTLCSPDMGKPAVLDRFRQVAPKVFIAVDGVHYGGRRMDRSAIVEEIRHELTSVVAMLVVRSGHSDARIADSVDFAAAQTQDDEEVATFEPAWLPFDHPLWIVYSSGTTGLPKAIVHGHGGMIISGCLSNLQFDIGPSYAPNTFGERFHWYCTTGWVMWNIQVGALLSGTTICLFDGAPSGPKTQPDWKTLWSFAARHRITWFGAGAAFYSGCRKAGSTIADVGDLKAVRALGSTGSPLPADVQLWGSAQFEALGRPNIWWCNVSGGTDIVLAFLVGNRELPPTPGRMQCRHLGAAVEAWDEEGRSTIGSVGELVCTRPLPSMPLYFWGDEDGSRYRSSYFSEWEGIWRHGDWLQIDADGSCTISGRSDATINRQGLRMGTAEIYAAVESLTEVADSLVIDLEDGAGGSTLLMFVVPRAGRTLDAELKAAMTMAIRTSLSPRFVPDIFVSAPAIPRTLSGKKQELPLKRLFQGWPVEKVINRDMIENPDVIPWYLSQARDWLTRSEPAR
jgi:acetoacetyl-CoA synthetase